MPELVDALLALPEPRTRLVWSRGLETWTRAGRVPRVSEELARHLPAPAPRATAPPPPAAAPPPAEVIARPARPAPAPPPVEAAAGLPKPLLIGGGALLAAIAAGALYVGLGGSPTVEPPPSGAATGGGPVATVGTSGGTGGVEAGTDPAAGGTATGAVGDPVVRVGWAPDESDLPADQIDLLKGVAAWEGDELTVTLYNGSRWRITEILVRTSVLEGDQFNDSALLYPLVPKQDVDAGVAPILQQVAPDRRRPSVNPDDTRAFSGKAGQKPRAYRWRIEVARGHAPLH